MIGSCLIYIHGRKPCRLPALYLILNGGRTISTWLVGSDSEHTTMRESHLQGAGHTTFQIPDPPCF